MLLEEPAAGLDAFRRRQVLRMMAEFVVDGNKSVLVTTYQTEGLASLADRMAILHHGRIILEADTEELLASWKWLRYRNGAVSQELEEALVCRESGDFGNRGLIRSYADVESHLETALAAGDLQVGNATIDDILVSLTGGK